MLLRPVYCLFLMCLLSGCSALKFSKKKEKPVPQPVEQQVPVSRQDAAQQPAPVFEADTTSEETFDSLPASADRSLQKPRPKLQPQPQQPVIRFSTAESQHVRLSTHQNNPFPASGEMQIDLGALQEEFCYPYPGKLISPYGYRGRSMHTGIDIKAVPNDTIRAAFAGVVRMSKPYSGYGNIVVIRHYSGIETVYAHNSQNLVDVNDVVQAGDPIALAGRTGRATTEHLHFELRVAGEHLNPTLMVDPEQRTLKPDTLYLSNRGGRIRGSHKPLPPYTESEEKKTNVSTAVPSASTTGGTPQYHIIRKGDTLSALARKYSTTVSKICALNGIKPTKILQIKERIRVR